MLNERIFAGTWMSRYPSLLFVHNVPEGRASGDVRKQLLDLLPIDHWFGIPDANQTNLLQSCSKCIVLFNDAKTSLLLALIDLTRAKRRIYCQKLIHSSASEIKHVADKSTYNIPFNGVIQVSFVQSCQLLGQGQH